MPNEILYTVPKEAVVIQDKRMHRYLGAANSANTRSTQAELIDAYRVLNIARGFYQALNGLGLLDPQNMVGEDIERVEKKILELQKEKKAHQIRKI